MKDFSRQWLLGRIKATATMNDLNAVCDSMSDHCRSDTKIMAATNDRRLTLMREEKRRIERGRK